MGDPHKDLILALDIGTTNARAAVIDKHGRILAIAFEPITLYSPHPGWYEICPDDLFSLIVRIIKKVISGTDERILGMGIAVQRNTFITWNARTGKHVHNFITWIDTRTTEMCEAWNNSYVIRAGKWIGWWLGKMLRSRYLMCASSFFIKESAIQTRLKWVFDNIPEAKKLHEVGELRFGTVDTWLIWKLTKGRTWATEYSCAGATGIYDFWKCCWCPNMTYLFGIPCDILPEVRDTTGFYGNTDSTIFGISVPICGVIGDQQASILGSQLFDKGDTKLTLGTGIVVNVNTGDKIHPTAHDVYPQIGWKFVDEKPTYIAEILSSNGGQCVNWAVSSGLLSDVSQASDVAKSVSNSDGVAFIPAFHGIQIPFRDMTAATSIFGITPKTCISNIIRAVLESQVFISKFLLDSIFGYYGKPSTLRVDGGVSKADFVVENLVSLCDVSIERAECVEGSLMGACFAAGLGSGLWKSTDDIMDSVRMDLKTFDCCDPDLDEMYLARSYKTWLKAAVRCQDWHVASTSS